MQTLFSSVIIPQAVYDELTVRFINDDDLFTSLKEEWIKIITTNRNKEVAHLLHYLDLGESEAIILAEELKADYLLIDEMEGRRVATRKGLQIIGTAGILLLGKKKNFITELRPELDRLRGTEGFWLDERIYLQLLRDAEESS